MSKRGKIFSVYLDPSTKARLEALSEEMSLSRSAVLRMLVGRFWKERHEQFLEALERFDEVKTKRKAELMQAGADSFDALAVAHRET